ncbi:MAG: transcriptional regulator [Planctomycetota bacterium]
MSRSKQDQGKPRTAAESARFAYDGLDRVLHEKARLGLMTCLAGADDGLTFGELKHLCGLTDGNLNRHLRYLHEADLVVMQKNDEGSRPQTVCALTEPGRQKFTNYLAELQRVLMDAQSRIETSGRLSVDGA